MPVQPVTKNFQHDISIAVYKVTSENIDDQCQ